MSRVYLPSIDANKFPADHAADVLAALIDMVELILHAKADKIDRDDIEALRDRIEYVRMTKIIEHRN